MLAARIAGRVLAHRAVAGRRALSVPAARTTADLPTVKPPAIEQEEGSGSEQAHRLAWATAPRTALIVKKTGDAKAAAALERIAQWLHSAHQISVVLEPEVYTQVHRRLEHVRTVTDPSEYTRTVDFVVTVGGDGTFLHVSSLFPARVPPLVPFAMGTLGFLLPFSVADFPSQLRRVIDGHARLLPRMRLLAARSPATADTPALAVTNEACIHRGTYPHLTTVSCYLDGHPLTTSVGDGIIVATPTGSTAYALSAGGPIVHPLVSSIVVAPVCPRSLSFRPLVLPPSAVVTLQVHEQSRGHASAYVDGRHCGELLQGHSVEIRRSPFPLMCVSRDDLPAGWAHDINQLLKFNRSFSSPLDSPFADHTRT